MPILVSALSRTATHGYKSPPYDVLVRSFPTPASAAPPSNRAGELRREIAEARRRKALLTASRDELREQIGECDAKSSKWDRERAEFTEELNQAKQAAKNTLDREKQAGEILFTAIQSMIGARFNAISRAHPDDSFEYAPRLEGETFNTVEITNVIYWAHALGTIFQAYQ
jgi:seryl-tRNA synthetase